MALVPLPVILPLLMAALLVGIGRVMPRRVFDLLSMATAAAVLVIAVLLLRAATAGTLVYWFGEWRPDAAHFPVGVGFAVDTLGAGMACVVATLVLAALAFSWCYEQTVGPMFHAMLMVFLAAMCGMCLSGDLFNLFVWFELMTATAVGLCGFESGESWPLLGALNFAVTNTVGAFITLMGVSLLYAQTGALNMAAVGRSLAEHPPGTMFLGAVLILSVTGFVVKMAAVPFQFWLADAHAVAPTPVCVLFSGVMVELGVFAVARVYWTVFAPALGGHDAGVRGTFLVMGAVTAVVAAVYCFGQRHLKRLLAFSTVSHAGLMLMGFALLRPGALAGVALYVAGHAAVKGCLFLCAGVLLHRYTSVDEFDLRGRGRSAPGVGAMMAVAAVGLAGVGPFGTGAGATAISDAADGLGMGWVRIPIVLAGALTAAAVLRVTGRVFLGWGPVREGTSRGSPHIPMASETGGQHDTAPAWMWVPAATLLVIGLGLTLVPGVWKTLSLGAARFTDSQGYAARVLEGAATPAHTLSVPEHWLPTAESGIAIAVALLLAAGALFPHRLGAGLNRRLGHALHAGMSPLRKLQSGRVGDYVAWLVLGIGAYGGLLLWWLR